MNNKSINGRITEMECIKCNKGIQEGWKICPFCETKVMSKEEIMSDLIRRVEILETKIGRTDEATKPKTTEEQSINYQKNIAMTKKDYIDTIKKAGEMAQAENIAFSNAFQRLSGRTTGGNDYDTARNLGVDIPDKKKSTKIDWNKRVDKMAKLVKLSDKPLTLSELYNTVIDKNRGLSGGEYSIIQELMDKKYKIKKIKMGKSIGYISLRTANKFPELKKEKGYKRYSKFSEEHIKRMRFVGSRANHLCRKMGMSYSDALKQAHSEWKNNEWRQNEEWSKDLGGIKSEEKGFDWSKFTRGDDLRIALLNCFKTKQMVGFLDVSSIIDLGAWYNLCTDLVNVDIQKEFGIVGKLKSILNNKELTLKIE